MMETGNQVPKLARIYTRGKILGISLVLFAVLMFFYFYLHDLWLNSSFILIPFFIPSLLFTYLRCNIFRCLLNRIEYLFSMNKKENSDFLILLDETKKHINAVQPMLNSTEKIIISSFIDTIEYILEISKQPQEY